MVDQIEGNEGEAAQPAPPTAPTGLKAKALQAVGKAYLAAPPPVQKATITVAMKVTPTVQKLAPYKEKILAGTLGLLALRRLRRRG
jgi:hypothetical protein